MAKFIKLQNSAENILLEYHHLQFEAEVCRLVEYRAAVRIQAWIRGTRTREYLRYLSQCVILIQRRWRGYRDRVFVYRLRKEKVFNMRTCYYNTCATKIQAAYRGYYSRENIFSFRKRQEYFECLRLNNEDVRAKLNKIVSEMNAAKEREKSERIDKALDDFARNNHHLISTANVPGIYNSPFQTPNQMEEKLRQVKIPRVRRATASFETCTKIDSTNFPPLNEKPQGPFRESREVQDQRYRPLSPTVRLAVDYEAMEKARAQYRIEELSKQITDETFELYRRPVPQPYEKLLLTAAEYNERDLIAGIYREETRQKWIDSQKTFQRVLPPIPVFSKFNKTYSKGQV